MRQSSRPLDPARQIEWLEQRHARLKEQVSELDTRWALTPEEQVERARLKKEKLATKDQLERLRRGSERPPQPTQH